MKNEGLSRGCADSVLIDGRAMESLLMKPGAAALAWMMNATRAEAVFRIHMAYLEAGAHNHRDQTRLERPEQTERVRLGDGSRNSITVGVQSRARGAEAAKHEV